MNRYFKTLRLFVSASLGVEFEYRANFILACLSSLLNLAGSIFAVSLFYRSGGDLGGWSWNEAMIVMGLFTFLDGIATAWLRPNLSEIVNYVQEGTMDFILIKPFDSQAWLSSRHISVWGIPNLLFGLVVIAVFGIRLNLSGWNYLAGLPLIGMGVVILYSLWFMIAATSVFFVKVHNATFVLRSVLEAGRYPVNAYPALYRVVFTFVLPVAFLTSVPAEVMLGRTHVGGIMFAFGLSLAMFIAARLFWRFSLRYYSSASS